MCVFAFFVSLHSSVQLGAIFCVHLVFLTGKIKHMQMQNSHYAHNVSIMLEQIPIFKRSIIIAGTLLEGLNELLLVKTQ